MEELDQPYIPIWETPPTVKTPIELIEYFAAVYGIKHFNTKCLIECVKTICLHATQFNEKYIQENFEAFMNSGIAEYTLDEK